METLVREVRFAIRSLARRPGFAATVVATLALGIAGTTVVFSLVSGALLTPPPFEHPDRLVLVYRTAAEGTGAPRLTRWSFPRLTQLRRSARSFEALAAFGQSEFNLALGREPERVGAEQVSAAYFSILRARPALGRLFRADEDSTPGTHPVAIIGHDLWVRRLGADTGIVGRSIRVNSELLTVIGVMPKGFDGLTGHAELWVPEMMAPRLSYREHLTTDQNFISVIGRLRAGTSVEDAKRELAVLGTRIAAELPDQDEAPATWRATAIPLAEARIDPNNRRALGVLFAAVGVLRLLACTNVAGLGVAEAVSRRQEITVRLALGAGRTRLIGQLLTETAVLGAAAGGLGTVVATYLVRVIPVPTPTPGPANRYGAVGTFASSSVDGTVLGFAVLASVVAILISGLIPAVYAGRTDLASELKDRTGAGRRGAGPVQAGLVVIEMALALVLAVGGGLLLESLRRLQAYPLGIDPEPVLTFRIQPSDVRYPSERAPELLDRVLAAVRGVPGVRLASVDACAPLGVSCANSTLYVVGRPEPAPDRAPGIMRHYVGPDHFATLGIPILSGRPFALDDRVGRPNVAIINQTAARRFFAGEDPLGRRIWFGGGSRFDRPDSSATIVGVVGDVPYGSLERGPVPSVYTPYRQFTYAFRTVMVRVDDLPIFEVRPLTERLGDTWARTRFIARLLGSFAVLALLLAVGGVYGVVSHSVNQRTREMGIRSALGATANNLVRLVVGQGVRLAAWGIGIGAFTALALGRLIGSLLYGVQPTDPVVFGGLSLVLAGAAGLASYWPARRAAQVDPVVSLRAN